MTEAGLRVHVNLGAFPVASGRLLERAVVRTLAAEGRSLGEVSLTLLSDDEIRRMNLDYLGRDAPTDVISFSLGDEDDLLGDIYVGVEQAGRQAAQWEVTVEEDLARLAIHGTLHVLGYDHPEGPERAASPMYELQEAYLGELMRQEGA